MRTNVFILLNLLSFHCYCQQIDSVIKYESSLKLDRFDQLNKVFDTLIMYHEGVLKEDGQSFKIMAVKNGHWFQLNNLSKKISANDSTLNIIPCANCYVNFKRILKAGLLTLPDEIELKTNCIKLKDTIVNGNKVIEINDINSTSDLPIYTVFYKIKSSRKNLAYRSPEYALQICPCSKERVAFVKIISLIKSIR